MSLPTLEQPALLPAVRETVRHALMGSPDYQKLDPSTRREIAQGLVKICSTALDLKNRADKAEIPSPRGRLAVAQSAGSEFSGVATQRVADTTRQILNAVSFPRFVTELINGVFKALVDSNQQQLTAYVELIRNVAASIDGFAQANVGLNGARQWLVERFPGSFVIEGEEEDPFAEPGQPLSAEDQAERDAETRLRLRPGASMPSEAAIRAGLGLDPNESVPGGDPENLVALARSALARNRQQMLSTMVMLGLQRIVIESGRLHASMRFHIDARSAAQEDRGSQFDARHTSTASGSFGYGPWGASATMTNTIGYVSSQKTQTTEEMNTDLDLNSSVELVFKTDYVPLDRLAGREQVDRIKVNTLNPEAEIKASTDEREAREKRISESEAKRREALDKAIPPRPEPPPAPKPGEAGSVEAADKARKDAKEREDKEKKDKGKDKSKDKKRPQPTPRPNNRAGAGTTRVQPRTQGLSLELGDKNNANPAEPLRRPDVIYVPTIDEAIDEMLELGRVTSGDLLYDLGCGDGRIVVRAAAKYGCRAIGFDIDSQRVAESRANVERNGLTSLVRIDQRDIFEVDLSKADVVTLYLLPNLNVRLIPQIEKMKAGARIVSQDFDMAGVIPDRVVQIYLPSQQFYKSFYLWTTPLKRTSGPVPHQWTNAKGITE